MKIIFRQATLSDCEKIASFVIELTDEISHLTDKKHFDINLNQTSEQCKSLISHGHYKAILAELDGETIAIATLSETYALYASGKVGLIQEFYVVPSYRSSGVGSLLLKEVYAFGNTQQWSCVELCTPPLPQFERTLTFYQRNGLSAVGGRKMRQTLAINE